MYRAAFVLRQLLQHDAFFATNYDHHHHHFSADVDSSPSDSMASSHSSLLVDCEHNEQRIEEQAFWTFAAVMSHCSTLFEHKLSGYHRAVAALTRMLQRHDPALWSFLARLDFDCLLTGVLIKWFTSLFAYPSFSLLATQKLWDVWLLQHADFAVLVKFALLTLHSHSAELMAMDELLIPQFCASARCVVKDARWMLRLQQLKAKRLYLGRIRDDDDEKESAAVVAIVWMRIGALRAEKSKHFGEYRVEVGCADGATWALWKRYSDFERLCHALKARGIESDEDAAFPAKSWLFKSNIESLMRARKAVLNGFMASVLPKCNRIGSLHVLHAFVGYFERDSAVKDKGKGTGTAR